MSHSPLAALEIEQPIAADLPAFDGHFPGAPVLPGAVLVALVLRAIAQRPEWARRAGTTPTLQQVKFLAAVGPGQTLQIRLEDTPNAIAFSVRCGTTVVARGQLTAAAP
jgi:3-hydroxymyristoyl/3-hydroxydecanoyl-(acyl carrier protein) dehydratase